MQDRRPWWNSGWRPSSRREYVGFYAIRAVGLLVGALLFGVLSPSHRADAL